MAVASCSAVATSVVAKGATALLGFGKVGIGGGTAAAKMMAAYGGLVPANGLVATLQSIGAAGIGVPGIAVGTAVGVTAYGCYKGYQMYTRSKL